MKSELLGTECERWQRLRFCLYAASPRFAEYSGLRPFPQNTIGDRHCGQISVPGGSSLRNFVLFSTRLHSNKHTQKPESSFLKLSDFFYRDTYRASRDTLLATVPVPMAPLHLSSYSTNDRACISTTLSLLKFVILLSALIYFVHNPIH